MPTTAPNDHPLKDATHDQLVAMIDATAGERDRFREDRDRWRDAKPLPDKEAAALAACVQGLDPLVDTTVTYHTSGSARRFERIVRYLAARYGVEWPTPRGPDQITATLSEDIRQGERVVVDVASGSAWRAP